MYAYDAVGRSIEIGLISITTSIPASRLSIEWNTPQYTYTYTYQRFEISDWSWSRNTYIWLLLNEMAEQNSIHHQKLLNIHLDKKITSITLYPHRSMCVFVCADAFLFLAPWLTKWIKTKEIQRRMSEKDHLVHSINLINWTNGEREKNVISVEERWNNAKSSLIFLKIAVHCIGAQYSRYRLLSML